MSDKLLTGANLTMTTDDDGIVHVVIRDGDHTWTFDAEAKAELREEMVRPEISARMFGGPSLDWHRVIKCDIHFADCGQVTFRHDPLPQPQEHEHDIPDAM